ncbi:phosphotransferase [Lactococcus kimchii]|uniref:phosphotransferase n=1 Tax=Lactococcus sp. S-13 TaxID=2507158 RepID=UPI0010235467|nr:phosphotransferase [Lactococcus sp. S-13]RZI49336.1 aminoglycoside phosphotransferase [Lactococcus sp. S-13]
MSEIIKNFINEKFTNPVGQAVNPGNIGETHEFARQLGNFFYQLHRLQTTDAPKPSLDNAFAGSDLIVFEAEILELLAQYKQLVPADLLEEKFEKAAKTKWEKAPVWVLGNLAARQLLVSDGKLQAVEGTQNAVIGDPACDLALAWILFDEKARKIFFAAAEADASTIDRARFFALRTALKNYQSADIDELIQSRDASTEILKDFNYTVAQDMY